jgi:predicted GNAT family N-acyltransferase
MIMQLVWIDKLDDQLHDQLFTLYQKQWWTKGRIQQDVINAFENSDVFIACQNGDGELIAFVRVLTDFTFKAMIYDLIVNEKYHKQHIGRQLLDKIITHRKLISVESFELYCPDHIAPFYNKCGFAKSTSGLWRLAPKNHR